MKILDRLWATNAHNKIAIGFVVLGLFLGTLIVTVRFFGVDGSGPVPEMELGELWVATLFPFLIAGVVKLDEMRLRKAAREKIQSRKAGAK